MAWDHPGPYSGARSAPASRRALVPRLFMVESHASAYGQVQSPAFSIHLCMTEWSGLFPAQAIRPSAFESSHVKAASAVVDGRLPCFT